MTKKALKIVTIGGGSTFIPELIDGYIARSEELPIKEIVLVDIEQGEERLHIAVDMAKRQLKKAGLEWKITSTLDRFNALKDADFVTTQFRVGPPDVRIKDERIPLSHGLLGHENNGSGGVFKAFRTIPVLLEIIEEMKEQCPDAWLINFTNPAGMVTEAAIKHGGWEKTIGICNVPIGHEKSVSEALEVPANELTFHFAGINHFHWHKVWDREGNELTEKVIKLLYHPDNQSKGDMENIPAEQFNYEQIMDLSMLPCGYHRYYYVEDEMLKLQIEDFNKGKTRAQEVKKIDEDLFELYKNPDLDSKPEELMKRGGAYYSYVACEVISSIYNDKHTEMVVSTQNKGTITDLPYDSIIETSGVVTSKGFVPYNWGAFDNPAARGMLQLMKGFEETVIRAAITGDYSAALHAFTINPLIPGGRIAKTLLDQMLYAHKEDLPQFARKIKEIEANQPEDVEYVDTLMKSN